MRQAPKSMRTHIGVFGRRNVGKSSLLNALTKQTVSIVSASEGTTTDPVEKTMELLPLGPVLFIDTAGIDDAGDLGQLRVGKTQKVFDRVDLALIVTDGQWGAYEDELYDAFHKRETPMLVVFNKSDIAPVEEALRARVSQKGLPTISVSALSGDLIPELRQKMADTAPDDAFETPVIAGDLVGAGEVAILVVPIDKEAPKGRLIMPQVQTIRDLLDSDAITMVVKERELRSALERLKTPPKLVITDSQAFMKVQADTPKEIPLTSFSILFARLKGDLVQQTKGILGIDALKSGDKVLIAEACTHRELCEDIGRVKIPRLLKNYTGADLKIDVVAGHDFPDNLSDYSLVIHCGACMWNKKTMNSRIRKCDELGIPITNYGMTIAHCLGITGRALQPFPAALSVFEEGKKSA